MPASKSFNKDQSAWLTTRVTTDRAYEVQQVADSLEVSRHKLLTAALELGLPLARYKLAIDQIKHDRESSKLSSSKLNTVKE